MAEKLTVRLGARSYWIYFERDLDALVRATVEAMQAQGRKVVAVTDESLQALQPQSLKAMLGEIPLFILPAGEKAKTLENYGRILVFLAQHRVDRRGVLLAVGGGVVGDLAGFAAATFLRGLDYYQIPTTLLAMVDSSVGGKTGLNLPAGKNLVGSFHQPRGVFIATKLLSTLPAREFAAGMAEALKGGLLGSIDLFNQLKTQVLTADSPELPAVIKACCALKAKWVESDEFEQATQGGRALLNLGHTFGHAIEQVSGYGTYLHGEAVAIGLAAAARLSRRLDKLSLKEVEIIEQALLAYALPIRLRTSVKIADLLSAMARDKKVIAGLPRFIILEKIGQAVTREGLDPALIEEIWREVGATDL